MVSIECSLSSQLGVFTVCHPRTNHRRSYQAHKHNYTFLTVRGWCCNCRTARTLLTTHQAGSSITPYASHSLAPLRATTPTAITTLVPVSTSRAVSFKKSDLIISLDMLFLSSRATESPLCVVKFVYFVGRRSHLGCPRSLLFCETPR